MSTAPAHTSLRSPHAESCGALALQPIGSGDEAALLAIFASTREQEREQFGWPEEQWNAFIRQQFMAQHTQYSTAYANPSFDLVLRDGEIAGRLYVRSEEHTSELQSHLNLVCRLLLEKKKIHIVYDTRSNVVMS